MKTQEYVSRLNKIQTGMASLLSLSTMSESQLLKFSYEDGDAKKVKAVRPILTAPLKAAMTTLQEYGAHREGLEVALRNIPNTPRAKNLRDTLKDELKDLDDAYRAAADSVMQVAQTGMPKQVIAIAQSVVEFLQTEYQAKGLTTQPTVWVADDELYYGSPLVFKKLGADGGEYTVGIIAHIAPDDTMKMYLTGDRGRVHLTDLPFDSQDQVSTGAQAVKRLKYHLDVDDIARQQGMVLPFSDMGPVSAKVKELGPHIVDIETAKNVMRVIVDRKKPSDRQNLQLALAPLVGDNVLKNAYFHVTERETKYKGRTASVYEVRLLKRLNSSDSTLLNRALDIRDALDLDQDEYRGLLDFIRTRKR